MQANVPGKPFVSVIIVNYNGWHYLPACLDALRQQTYPVDCFEVIVSDNASKDGSVERLKASYPWVRVIANKTNFGFATGNNLAIRQARGSYVVLLNNDTAPSPTWMEELVRVAEADPKTGIVTGHLHLFYDQLVLDLQVQAGQPDAQSQPLQTFSVDTGTPRGVVQYLDGFSGVERDLSGRTFRWVKARSQLGIPIPFGGGDIQLRLELASTQPVELTVSAVGEVCGRWQVKGPVPAVYEAVLPESARQHAGPLEQNTGSIVFYSGAGRDRGTYVQNTDLLFERDQGQYPDREEVFAGCGASLLLKRAMLEDIGLLDDSLFMYYEDTDLAWRARSRGWKVVYASLAEVRHIHCGTTKEWSPFFVYLIERNRLAMVFKNGSFRQVTRVWGGYGLKVARLAWTTLKKTLRRKPDWRRYASELRIHLRVLATLFLWQPSLWSKRARIQGRRSVSTKIIESWFAGAE